MTRVFSPRMVQKPARAAVSSAVAAGSGTATRGAQRVGEVVLLDGELADRGDLVGRPELGAVRRGEARGPRRAARVARRGVLAGADQLHPAELAHRLEHPVAHRPAGVDAR